MSSSTPSQHPAYAAIDLGTNNCRLLIAYPNGESETGMSVIDGFSRTVRLGEGMGKTGRLSNAAIDRITEALKVCARKIKSRGVCQTRAIATEFCRQAANDESFFRHVAQKTAIQLRIITSTEEAELTLDGCLSLLTTGHPRILMFDIGDGSTELMWLKKEPSREPSVIDILSLPFGVVSLAEEYGPDALSTKAFEAIIKQIDAELELFENNHRISSQITIGNVHALGTSETVTTMGSIYLNQARYARTQADGLSIRCESIHAICENLISLDFKARENHPCIGPRRADLMIMGCVILTAILRRWPATHLTAADRGICEGLLLGMMNTNLAVA